MSWTVAISIWGSSSDTSSPLEPARQGQSPEGEVWDCPRSWLRERWTLSSRLWEEEMPPSTPGQWARHWGNHDTHLWLHEEQHSMPVASSLAAQAALHCRYPRGWARGPCWPPTACHPARSLGRGTRCPEVTPEVSVPRGVCLSPEVPPSMQHQHRSPLCQQRLGHADVKLHFIYWLVFSLPLQVLPL